MRRTIMASLIIVAPVAIVTGCGTRVGNPDASASAATQEAPQVDFQVPTPAALAITLGTDGMVGSFAERVNSEVTKLNADIAEMNKEYVFPTPTTIKGKGPGGLDSGTFSVLTDGVYNYQVVVCRSGKVSKFIKWSSDSKHIESIRDLNQKPDAAENVHVRTVYAQGTDKTLTLTFYGVPKGIPEGAEGDMLASWDEAKQGADSNFTVRSVADWFKSGETLSPDEYLTGTLTAAGSGEYVGWSKRVPNRCSAFPTLNEASPSEQWCTSRKIGASNDYNQTEASEAWTSRLSTIGIAPAANLGDVDISVVCP